MTDGQQAGDMLTFAEAASLTGTSTYRIGAVVKRAGVTVYTNPRDGRKKYIKREDVGLLAGYYLVVKPEPPF